jgi:hypothetical protein
LSHLATSALQTLGGVDPAVVPTVTAAAAAAVGAFVAYQAHRGYRRNASRAMLYLAVGVLALTTVPFFVRELLLLAGVAGTAAAELAAQVVRIAGLLVVLYAVTGPSGGDREPPEPDG